MAAIRNSIVLQDRMTPVFRSIIKSMDSTMRVMRNLDRQANKGVQSKAYQLAQRDINRANNELIRMQNNLGRADRATGKLATSTNKVASNMSRIGAGGFNLSNLAAGLYLLKNIANALKSVMETPDTMNAIQYRLQTYDNTEATGGQLFDAAYAAAMRSRSDLESTANLASRILISGATYGSGAESMQLAEILNKSSFLGGSSSQESQRALLQLSQALASGTLQGDELRAIREQAPGLTDTLSKGLSSLAKKGALPDKFLDTAAGDLKQLGADGELTADRVVAAFKEMGQYVDETFANSPKQFGQAMKLIGNVWKRWLKLMSEGDNALAKINEGAWKLLEWFSSADGQGFLVGLAQGINIVVEVISTLLGAIGSLINWFRNLESSGNIVKAMFISLAIVGVAAASYLAGAWIIAWTAMAWPVLLIIAILALVIYTLMEFGVTGSQIIGAICGAFVFLAYIIYDLVIAVLVILGEIGVAVGMAIILVIQGIVQLILWAVTSIWAVLVILYDAIYTLVKGIKGAFKGMIVGVYQLFVWLANGVLKVLQKIASAVDAIFGSNLASAIGGWMSGLDSSVDMLNDKLDPKGEFEDIGDQWKTSMGDLGDMYAGNGKYDDMNIIDNMGDTWNSGVGGMKDIYNWGDSAMADPMAGWDSGYNFGAGLGNIGGMDFNMGLNDMGNLGDMSQFDNALKYGVPVDGGNLDSVGKIKSDVDISDEDLQLLRDMAARDFLLTLQTSTPQVNNNFGDVRETADIGKILETIQDMVDEQLATSLVVD